MTQPVSEKPIKLNRLNIDVDQWRRDIQTFASTTKRVLDAISAELSNDCAKNSGKPIPSAPTGPQTAVTNSLNVSQGETPGEDDRLAKLKSQLAKRISKSN